MICSRSQISVAAAKEMVDAARSGTIDPAVVRRWAEAPNPDAVEGLDAFLGKRTPDFPGSAAAGGSGRSGSA